MSLESTYIRLNLENIASTIRDNKDVQFLWTMLSAEWEGSATSLLQMVVTQWVKIRGFAYASAWMEKYKAAQKKTTQKSKGIRKHLTSKPVLIAVHVQSFIYS